MTSGQYAPSSTISLTFLKCPSALANLTTTCFLTFLSILSILSLSPPWGYTQIITNNIFLSRLEMKTNNKDLTRLLKKVEGLTKDKKLDLSSSEDLSIGIMNLISIEEHLFFTSQKTGKVSYLNLLNEVRLMRTELLKEIIKDSEGEVWCISKHLLAASMRLLEVGTKELKKGNKEKAWDLFEKSYKLYSLFWGINLGAVKIDDVKRIDSKVSLIDEKAKEKASVSVFDKLGALVQKAIDCCRE